MTGDDIWNAVVRIAAVVTLPSLPYLVYDRRKRLPNFRFIFSGSHGRTFQRDNLTFGEMVFSGSIQNRSLDPNSVEKVYLIVWRTKRKRNTLRLGFGGNVVRDKDNQIIGPPIRFLGRESKQVSITCEFPLTGTQDAQLFTAMMPLPGHPNFQINRYTYELAFEDIAGNLFDKDGLPRSMKTLNLRWTLDNAWQRLRDGHPFDFIKQVGAIVVEDVRFAVARLFRGAGV